MNISNDYYLNKINDLIYDYRKRVHRKLIANHVIKMFNSGGISIGIFILIISVFNYFKLFYLPWLSVVMIALLVWFAFIAFGILKSLLKSPEDCYVIHLLDGCKGENNNILNAYTLAKMENFDSYAEYEIQNGINFIASNVKEDIIVPISRFKVLWFLVLSINLFSILVLIYTDDISTEVVTYSNLNDSVRSENQMNKSTFAASDDIDINGSVETKIINLSDVEIMREKNKRFERLANSNSVDSNAANKLADLSNISIENNNEDDKNIGNSVSAKNVEVASNLSFQNGNRKTADDGRGSSHAEKGQLSNPGYDKKDITKSTDKISYTDSLKKSYISNEKTDYVRDFTIPDLNSMTAAKSSNFMVDANVSISKNSSDHKQGKKSRATSDLIEGVVKPVNVELLPSRGVHHSVVQATVPRPLGDNIITNGSYMTKETIKLNYLKIYDKDKVKKYFNLIRSVDHKGD